MTRTLDLITKLTSEAQAVKPIKQPLFWVVLLFVVLVTYAVIFVKMLGWRADLAEQFQRPFFALEIFLLVVLFLSSIVCAVLTMYPDLYQKSRLLKIPYLTFFAILGIFLLQLVMPQDLRMSVPQGNFHKMECTICILFLAFVPAILIFMILQKGATIKPLQAGIFTVFAATALGYFILRLYETNDAVSHILIWHFLPMIVFAALGALIGKSLLKW